MRDAFPALDHPALRARAEWEALYDHAQEVEKGESDYAREFREAAKVPDGLSDPTLRTA